MTDRAAELTAIIRASGLTRRECAARLKVSNAAIDAWMRPETSRARRIPGAPVLELALRILPSKKFEKNS